MKLPEEITLKEFLDMSDEDLLAYCKEPDSGFEPIARQIKDLCEEFHLTVERFLEMLFAEMIADEGLGPATVEIACTKRLFELGVFQAWEDDFVR